MSETERERERQQEACKVLMLACEVLTSRGKMVDNSKKTGKPTVGSNTPRKLHPLQKNSKSINKEGPGNQGEGGRGAKCPQISAQSPTKDTC